jgi:hypothetical protein
MLKHLVSSRVLCPVLHQPWTNVELPFAIVGWVVDIEGQKGGLMNDHQEAGRRCSRDVARSS